MTGSLEDAGFGVVVYDYPFNRDLDETCEQFRRDWLEFRRAAGETRPWALVGHSMGALVARSYIEDPRSDGRDVSTLIMIAPVNQGASLAKVQTLYQLLSGIQAIGGRKASDPLAHLGDGLGKSAEDILPGSAFLTALNRRPRRAGVAYHILAGDVGVLSPSARRQVEAQVETWKRQGGILGGMMARLAGGDDLAGRLDELSDGLGDGCVSVARTRLEGVTDQVVIHANHAELIRAPLLFRDPGPVACMPYLLRWLKAPTPTSTDTAVRKP
jgi:pimeloyl-ACP methyl ester carboxylesterase